MLIEKGAQDGLFEMARYVTTSDDGGVTEAESQKAFVNMLESLEKAEKEKAEKAEKEKAEEDPATKSDLPSPDSKTSSKEDLLAQLTYVDSKTGNTVLTWR